MIIKRYLSQQNFDRMNKDFNFLIKKILPKFYGEIGLELRDDYFNLYCRGNSLSKVEFLKNGDYIVSISNAFYEESKVFHHVEKINSINRNEIPHVLQGNYHIFTLNKTQLHPFFQQKHLIDLCQKIKVRNYCEELSFEQMIITENLNRSNLIIIDRQITDKSISGRMDLLILRQLTENQNQYYFQVVEGKLGNNKELSSAVAGQLQRYCNHIDINFDAYKKCYEKNYCQKYALGLISIPNQPKIDIVKPVDGMVVVIGYSGLAQKQIQLLKTNYPNINVYPLDLKLT